MLGLGPSDVDQFDGLLGGHRSPGEQFEAGENGGERGAYLMGHRRDQILAHLGHLLSLTDQQITLLGDDQSPQGDEKDRGQFGPVMNLVVVEGDDKGGGDGDENIGQDDQPGGNPQPDHLLVGADRVGIQADKDHRTGRQQHQRIRGNRPPLQHVAEKQDVVGAEQGHGEYQSGRAGVDPNHRPANEDPRRPRRQDHVGEEIDTGDDLLGVGEGPDALPHLESDREGEGGDQEGRDDQTVEHHQGGGSTGGGRFGHGDKGGPHQRVGRQKEEIQPGVGDSGRNRDKGIADQSQNREPQRRRHQPVGASPVSSPSHQRADETDCESERHRQIETGRRSRTGSDRHQRPGPGHPEHHPGELPGVKTTGSGSVKIGGGHLRSFSAVLGASEPVPGPGIRPDGCLNRLP